MLRVLAVLGILAIIGAAAFASAASLDVNGGAIQAGSDDDLTCDDSVAVTGWGLEVDTGLVTDVTISDVNDVTCAGSDLFVLPFDDTTWLTGQGVATIVAGTTSYKIAFPTPVNAADIVEIKVWIEGPTP